jgi:hypothetical protein
MITEAVRFLAVRGGVALLLAGLLAADLRLAAFFVGGTY